jgi:hypothetical protein
MVIIAEIILAVHLVQFTGPDNQVVLINPDTVISIREPRGPKGEHFHPSTNCLIFTSDGKYTSVTESCNVVRDKLESPAEE